MTQQKYALISVYDKAGVNELARALAAAGYGLLSTGGTAKMLRSQGLRVTDVAAFTGQSEIFGGRVKTLHPKIHGGILARLDDPQDQQEMARDGIVAISVVVANLYPFEAQWQDAMDKCDNSDLVEWVDIGGPTMIRAAAKNYAHVSAVTDPDDYPCLIEELASTGSIAAETRLALAQKAFQLTASYDCAVATWFQTQTLGFSPHRTDTHIQTEKIGTGETVHNAGQPGGDNDKIPELVTPRTSLSGVLVQSLRYGENPHQRAAAYRNIDPRVPKGLMSAQQIQGKELSFNNFNDADAALRLVREFTAKPACVIVKHANPCGVAQSDTLLTSYQWAKRCDPTSAFGGIVAVNRALTGEVATAITQLFTEVVIAPMADESALAIFAQKPNIRLLLVGDQQQPSRANVQRHIKMLSDGFLVQDWDQVSTTTQSLVTVTARKPSAQETQDLVFAQRIAKHVASNTIVLAKDGQTLGIGAGQMSRIDALRIALWKAQDASMDLTDAVMASDAFFPFPDVVELAASHGIRAVIHPGGSMNDDKVTAAANRLGLAMVTTGTRHFRH